MALPAPQLPQRIRPTAALRQKTRNQEREEAHLCVISERYPNSARQVHGDGQSQAATR